MVQIQYALSKIKDPYKDSKTFKDLQTSLKEATNSYIGLQTELGISRRKRQEDKEDSPLQYIEKIKSLSGKFIDSRLKKLICGKCGQILGKYLFYVPQEGEEGSIENSSVPISPYKYIVQIKCWKCDNIAMDSN